MTTNGKDRPGHFAVPPGNRSIQPPLVAPGKVMPGKPLSDRRLNLYIDGYNFYVPLTSSGKESDYELAWCNFWRLGEHLVQRLSQENHTFAGCRLGTVKYFTATIPEGMPSNPSGVRRKHNWLDALNKVSGGRIEVIHGTFRSREHRFYIESGELDQLVRAEIPIHWDLIGNRQRTYHPKLKVHEEKQTDVMLASALITDAALGRTGSPARDLVQQPPLHRTNTRPTPAPCQAAILMSGDIDFLPAAEMAAQVFNCPVAIAFAYPKSGYRLSGLAKQQKGLCTWEISEAELRNCMLPELVESDGGRSLTLAEFRRTHFQRGAPVR